ncbi:MAG: hypothetical protein LBP80_02755 [Treponema sp.]|jgi:hypothetical protein|nr:hypothetical protein [Treponema sp.]
MKRNSVELFALGLFALCMFVSCVSTPPPQWAKNLEDVFPSDRYIAVAGTSDSRKTASQAAQTALSFYFRTQVSSRTDLAESYRNQNGAVSQSVQLNQQMLVQTATDLHNVRYTDPWRNPATGLWESAAYIDREEAWAVYSPQAKKAADTFAQLFVGAQQDTDPFTRALRFGKAETYAAGEEFVTARNFAQILHQARAKALFDEADGYRSALPREAADARRNARVYLEIPFDLNGLIRNAATTAFSDAGFPIAAESRGAAVICVIEVDENPMPRPPGTGTFYQPKLSGKVTSLTGTRTAVFSFTVQAEVQSAIEPALARNRAYTALAQALRDTLPERLRE